MNNEDSYYKRQIILPELGKRGQEKLKEAKALVIGVGGLGSPLLTYLSVAGIGHISIYDHDSIEESNLNRQILFDPADAGRNKAQVAAEKLSLKNPFIDIKGHDHKFNSQIDISQYDIIIDCTDNFKTKFTAHDLAYKSNKKFCVASIHKFEGQVQLFDFATEKKNSPCMRCLWEQRPSDTCVQTCEEAGVIGAVAGVVGTIQAMEIIKSLAGIQALSNDQNLLINLLDFSSFKIKLSKNEQCPLCGNSGHEITEPDNDLEIDYSEARKGPYLIVSLSDEYPLKDNIIKSKLSDIVKDLNHLKRDQMIAVICNRGITSLKAVKLLRKQGYLKTYSVREGMSGLN